MPVNTILTIGNDSYDILRCRYGFRRSVDANGRPRGGITGGEILLEIESTEDTLLFERLISKRMHCISGRIEVWDTREQTRMRSITWETAHIYSYAESMNCRSGQPMTFTIAITPLRLDIDPTIRLDRRWPETYGFRWQEYLPEEGSKPVHVGDRPTEEKRITRIYWSYGKVMKRLGSKSRHYPDMNLHIETSGYNDGEEISVVIKNNDDSPLVTSGLKQIVVTGPVDENGEVIIKEVLKNYTLYI